MDKDMTLEEQSVKLQVWDSAGQDQYFAISKITIKKVHGIILVYDTTKEQTFGLVRKWLDRTQQGAREDAVFFIVGNKADLEEHREVETHEGADLAKENGFGFFETSAKTGHHVGALFEAIARKALAVKSAKRKNGQKRD